MKKNLGASARICSVMIALAGLTQSFADPLLPYTLPIADKLSNDIATLQAIPNRTTEQTRELNRDNSALRAYHRTATVLNSDISILKSLHQLLASNPAYPPLLDQAAADYLADFQSREAALRRTAAMAPRSNVRTNTYKQLNAVSNILAKGEAATTTGALITQLGSAARKLVAASNATARAAAARVRLGSAAAKVGRIWFIAPPDFATGTNEAGILDFYSTDNGLVRRSIEFHLEGVTSDTPAEYELGVGANTATYSVVDPQRKIHGTNFTAQFHAIPGPETNRSVVVVDAITTNYIVGRFKFTALTTNEVLPADTNLITTITNGEFQITF